MYYSNEGELIKWEWPQNYQCNQRYEMLKLHEVYKCDMTQFWEWTLKSLEKNCSVQVLMWGYCDLYRPDSGGHFGLSFDTALQRIADWAPNHKLSDQLLFLNPLIAINSSGWAKVKKCLRGTALNNRYEWYISLDLMRHFAPLKDLESLCKDECSLIPYRVHSPWPNTCHMSPNTVPSCVFMFTVPELCLSRQSRWSWFRQSIKITVLILKKMREYGTLYHTHCFERLQGDFCDASFHIIVVVMLRGVEGKDNNCFLH